MDVADSAEMTALATGERAFATVGLRVGDETRWVEVAAHPLERSGQRWVAATYKDVSERLRIEAALKQAEAADRAKSDFLSRMSHELRTPLNAVLGFAQLLQIDELAPNQQEAVDQILRAGHHLLGLLNEVLDLERITSGRLDVQRAAGARDCRCCRRRSSSRSRSRSRAGSRSTCARVARGRCTCSPTSSGCGRCCSTSSRTG